MIRFCKIFICSIFLLQSISISCKTKSKSTTKNIDGQLINRDSILSHFKHNFNDTLPSQKNYVSDFENLFTAKQEDSLNQLLNLFEKQTTIQFAVVSFDTATVQRHNFDELTLQLANAWGVGDKDKHNGILMGICTGYKKIRIQNGKGIEKILSNAETKNIIDSIIIPHYKQADFFAGTLKGLNAIIQKLQN